MIVGRGGGTTVAEVDVDAWQSGLWHWILCIPKPVFRLAFGNPLGEERRRVSRKDMAYGIS